ncbi:hypothetical protein CR513_07997, partial [Mucuna pruriens]
MDKSMIDADSGGALMDKTPAVARHLISNMANNTQQFEIRGPSQSRMSQSNFVAPIPQLAESESDKSLPRPYRLKPGQMENNDKTLKELATPDVVYQPWCIQYPQLELAQTYESKSSLIHLLPKFHGLVGEDPHKHLKEFHVVCSIMRP